MFLFSGDYFAQCIVVPDGLAAYAAEFLTQFYYITWIGALILAMLYVFIQRMVWILAKRLGAADAWYPLSFVPVLILWFYMGDENVMLSFAVSLLLGLIASYYYNKVRDYLKITTYIYIVFVIPAFYWLFGANVFVLVGFIAIIEALERKVFFPMCVVIYTLAVILVCAQFLQYPLYRLLGGISYYRYPAYIPYLQILIMILMAVVPFIIAYLPKAWAPKSKTGYVTRINTIIIALAVIGFFLVKFGFSKLKYDIIDYDYLVRTEQWNKIIDKAMNHQASTPMGVACVNMALAKTGQLGDRLFEFYQNGGEGLFPAFQRDMTTPLATSEIFYSLGMINDAQRYVFEAQEAIPNYLKSGRCTKRLAETNLINGNYGVAAKYLRMLQKTLFYSDWANKTIPLLHNETAINSNPIYGTLRRYRQKKHDYLFSDREMDQMLGMLFVGDYSNRLAFEYLMAFELLQRDLQHFSEYYPLGKYANFDHIPRSYQEALVYMWTQTHPNFNGMPWSISQDVCQNMTVFAQAYMHNPNDPSLSTGILGQTFWSYLLVNKGGTNKGKEVSKPIY